MLKDSDVEELPVRSHGPVDTGRRSAIGAALLLPLPGISVAQDAISLAALVGQWRLEATHPSGAILVSDVVLSRNLRFSATGSTGGRQLMAAAGTWSLIGTTLKWVYESNTASVPPPGWVDEDEVMAVTPEKLVLRSALSGKLREYMRVR